MATITGTPAVGGNAATTSASWKGMTLDELKMRNKVSGRTIQVADKGLNCAENIFHAKRDKA